MSLLNSITKTKKDGPRRVFLYGVEGVGKSTFAAKAPKPIFIQTEEGLSDIQAEAFPLAKSFGEVMRYTDALASEDHDYQTLVLDSADWFERLIHKKVAADASVDAISDIDFGKGYGKALAMWDEWLKYAGYCRDKGMNIVVLGHCQIDKFSDPQNDSYDRYAPKLHKASSAVIREWVDEVLFATYQVFTSTEKLGFGKEVKRGISDGSRVLKTTERPAYLAKNHCGMPDEIPLDWNAYWNCVQKGGEDGNAA